MTNSAPILNSQQPPGSTSIEHLRDVARAAASWDVVHRPNTTSTFPARVRSVEKALKLLEADLASTPIPDAAT